MYAQQYEEGLRHFYSHPKLYRPCGLTGTILKVRVHLDPEGRYYGWHYYDGYFKGKVSMIYSNRIGTEMCFTYGSKAEEERGRGKIVRLRVEILGPVEWPEK
jgi:hypothetical protein